jgi:long-chain acyl-CoA synthetase
VNDLSDYYVPDVSIPDMLRRTAARRPRSPAVVFGGRTLDFATVDALGDRVAAALAAKGVAKGDRIGLWCPNSDGFVVAYCGIVKAGATVVPINVLLNPKEVAWILADAGTRGLLFFEDFAPGLAEVRAAVPALRPLASIGEGDPVEGAEAFRDWLASPAPPPAVAFRPTDDIAAILYTSGTTGRPKGAMLAHRNLVANTCSILEALRLEPGSDIILVVLPLFHSFAATVGMLFPLLHGCTLVAVPRFDPALVADAIEAARATIFLGVPSMYAVLLRLPDGCVAKLASLRFCVSGGAALPVEVMRRFEERFGKVIYEGDGPTECSPVTCVNPVGGLRKPGTVGLPIPGVAMKILDDAGGDVPGGQVGEICVRGPNVFKGYWNRPDETRESFFGEWFRTGDLGTRDEDGYFSIVDRKKDMIIVNGMNVYPRAVEEVLYRMEAVREAAVVGDPHPLHGEIPVAHLALKDGASATEEEVRDHCREHLGRHEIPRKVRFHRELPKNAAGKILKRELRRSGEVERGVQAN